MTLKPPSFTSAPRMRRARWKLFATGALLAAEAAFAQTTIPANDARFNFVGRFDVADPSAPVVIWQDSRIAIDFDGPELALRLSDVQGQVFCNAEVDGQSTLVELRQDAAPGDSVAGQVYNVRIHLAGGGQHRFVLTKRSEAAAGTVRFHGLVLAAGAQARAPARVAGKMRMQFFGDSITAGACNEDGDDDQWNDRRTHNSTRGYATMTAAAFSAEHRNIAMSGMGVVTGWTAITAGQIWDRVSPDPTSPRADLRAWVPDVVFVNLGENDDSFTTAKQQPFPAEAFTAGYVALVRKFREAWPKATIVILRGGMYGGSQSERLRGPWENGVAELEARDPSVSHFVFQHWSRNHPRVADHRVMADELIAWLREQPFLAAAR